jgi:hypothetical protein
LAFLVPLGSGLPERRLAGAFLNMSRMLFWPLGGAAAFFPLPEGPAGRREKYR